MVKNPRNLFKTYFQESFSVKRLLCMMLKLAAVQVQVMAYGNIFLEKKFIKATKRLQIDAKILSLGENDLNKLSTFMLAG